MPEQSIVSSQIDTILAQRKTKAEEMRTRKKDLQELKRVLMGFAQFSGKAKAVPDPALQAQCVAMFSKVRIPMELMKQLDAILQRVDEAVRRFERDSLNIATVGRARQGKSTFLQAVGSLGDDIIPAFDAGDCTGAVSLICNDPSIPKGQVRVDLTFRTREELLEIVRGYIGNISPDYLAQHAITYSDIAYISIPELEGCIEAGDAGRTIQLEHLRRIVDDFNGSSNSCSLPIADLCGRGGISLTDPKEIRKYVAQNNGRSIDDPLRENYYSYLAVKQAVIHCPFCDDVGKLVLVDTIGLGDTQYGIEGAMLDTVDKQCDAAIVVTKPDSGIKDQDQRLYDLLRNRFRRRDTASWLFYLANLQPGYNANAVDTFVNNVRERNFAVAGCKKINCKDPEQVRTEFLLPMLNTLLGNLAKIDAAYIAELDQLCAQLKQSLLQVVESFPKAENMSSETVLGLEVNKLGKKCYAQLTSNLARQVSYWYQLRSTPNATLWNRVKDILNNLESVLPSAEVLQQVLDESGTMIGADLWQTPLNYVRNEITDQFISIDGLMERETLEFKNAIVHDLYESLKNLSGQVGGPIQEGDDADQTAWLWGVMEPLLRDKPEYIQIYKAFQFLNQFGFNVRAQLIQEVRNQLRIINPMTPEYYMQPNYVFSKANIGQAVHFYLTSRLAILEDGLRHSLAKVNKLPNLAFYAAAEEFYDRLTFASDFKNGTFVDMSEVWGEFFTEYSRLLWSAEVERHKSVDVLMREFEQYQEQLMEKLSVLG